MTRGDPRGQRSWRKLRAHLIATTPRPVICWRCEQEISDPYSAHLGHVVDLALLQPGEPVQVALEHPACNLSAGGQLGAVMARKGQPDGLWISVRPRMRSD